MALSLIGLITQTRFLPHAADREAPLDRRRCRRCHRPVEILVCYPRPLGLHAEVPLIPFLGPGASPIALRLRFLVTRGGVQDGRVHDRARERTPGLASADHRAQICSMGKKPGLG